jgi:hypothetical protein
MYTSRYIKAAALAGAGWALLPAAPDFGVRDMQPIACIPQSGQGFFWALLCGAATGIGIALLFGAFFRGTSRQRFAMLPLLTVPTAVVLFSLLVRLERRVLGVSWHDRPRDELLAILSAYGVYGFGCLPLLYPLALVTQWWISRSLRSDVA